MKEHVSSPRKEWIREKRLQGIAVGRSSAHSLANSLPASFPGRNECPRTHCSLIAQWKETVPTREFEVKDGGEERRGRLVGAAKTSREFAK